jgi:nucleotide-binding universal stress UspA family protein
MKLRSILAATDFSANARRAALRAGLLGRSLGVRKVILMHVALRFPLSRGKQSRASLVLHRKLRRLADELEAETGLRFEPRLARGPVVDELARASRQAGLVVVGAQGAHPLRDFAIGTIAERLLRKCRRPVLVVKGRPGGAYRKVLVPVDFSADSRAAATLAAQLAPKAALGLLHAFEAPFEGRLRSAGVDHDSIRRYRKQARAKAHADMAALIEAAGIASKRITRSIVHGYPSALIAQAARESGAGLVAIGKHGQSMIEDLLLGSVTLHTLSSVGCDVLVVPPGVRQTGRARR